MANVDESSGSAPPSTGPKYPAPKDKQCPYCHQLFTSSSLGRHLDLYIKPKNPKPPDGKHDVEEIRRIRGHITRRQPKSGSKRALAMRASSERPANGVAADTPSKSAVPSNRLGIPQESGRETPSEPPRAGTIPIAPHPPATSASVASASRSEEAARESASPAWLSSGGKLADLWRPTWRATGVISGLPPRPVTAFQWGGRDANGGTAIATAAEREAKERLDEQLETGVAAQRALKEMWNVLEGLNQPKPPAHPFPFDPTAQNFPGLCLRILEPPPTLYSSTPFAMSTSCSISAPGPSQYDTLARTVQERLAEHSAWMDKWRAQQSDDRTSGRSATTDSPATTADDPPCAALTEHEAARIMEHVNVSYAHFSSLSAYDKTQAWQTELLRAYFEAAADLRTARRELDAARAEIESLRDGWLGFERLDGTGREAGGRQWYPNRLERTMTHASGIDGAGGGGAAVSAPRARETGRQRPGRQSVYDEVRSRLGLKIGPGDSDGSAFEALLQRFREVVRQEERDKPREAEPLRPASAVASTAASTPQPIPGAVGNATLPPLKRPSVWMTMSSESNGTHYDPIEREFREHRLKRARPAVESGGMEHSDDQEDEEDEEQDEAEAE